MNPRSTSIATRSVLSYSILPIVLLTLLWGSGATRAHAQIAVIPIATGLIDPLFATAPSSDPRRLYVLERDGLIRVIRDDVLLSAPFLDVRDRVTTAGEGGLLGLAFSPDFATSGDFYIYYTNLAGDSQVSRFNAAGDPDFASDVEAPILQVSQPYPNHNGGTIAFGADGFLYFSPGDGGLANDPGERAQNPGELLGKMLRIDPGPTFAPGSTPVLGTGYAIPEDNPFVGAPGARGEIWAFGLRNPYRFSFDRLTGDLWIADVGQDRREEIDFEPASSAGGLNWGWDVMEGTLCNPNDPAYPNACNAPFYAPPIFEYAHTAGNCSITGGFLARGGPAEWNGEYIYGDYCTGRIWSLDPAAATSTEWTSALGAAGGVPFSLSGFGEDGRGRLYVVQSRGTVYRVEARSACNDGLDNDGDGDIDFGSDAGCGSTAAIREDPACNDGVDNDGDGAIDLADSGCMGNPSRLSENPVACGLGPELAFLLGGLGALRRRRRATA